MDRVTEFGVPGSERITEGCETKIKNKFKTIRRRVSTVGFNICKIN